MAHPQQLKFISLVEEYFIRPHKPHLKVLEVGSFDVNGSVRSFFSECDYIGADLSEGPGVDLVCSGDKIDLPDASFNITISCECFEHNPNWVETFKNMYRMTKDGGLVIATCASAGRVEHGTRRTSPEASPGTQSVGIDYYKNLTKEDFESVINFSNLFEKYRFFYIPTSCDLYFIGWKLGASRFAGDVEAFFDDVMNIGSMKFSPLWKRLLISGYQLPVDIARKVLNEDQFQDFAIAYLNKTRRVRDLGKALLQR